LGDGEFGLELAAVTIRSETMPLETSGSFCGGGHETISPPKGIVSALNSRLLSSNEQKSGENNLHFGSCISLLEKPRILRLVRSFESITHALHKPVGVESARITRDAIRDPGENATSLSIEDAAGYVFVGLVGLSYGHAEPA